MSKCNCSIVVAGLPDYNVSTNVRLHNFSGPTKVVSGRPVYSPALYQVTPAIVFSKFLVSIIVVERVAYYFEHEILRMSLSILWHVRQVSTFLAHNLFFPLNEQYSNFIAEFTRVSNGAGILNHRFVLAGI